MAENDMPDEVVRDDSPVLAEVAEEFNTPEMAEAFKGVEIESLPKFKDLKRMLPAQRFHVKRVIADIGQTVSKDFTTDSADLSTEQLAAADDMMTKAQTFVLDMAEDEDAMKQWLVGQESGESALMAAFAVVAKRLGN